MVSYSCQLNDTDVPIDAGAEQVLDGVMFCLSSVYSNSLFDSSVNSRWEEERYTDGSKWKFLEHKGPVFAPPYEPLPSHVKFSYDGKIVINNNAFYL